MADISSSTVDSGLVVCKACGHEWPFRPHRPASLGNNDLYRGTRDGKAVYVLDICPKCGAEWITTPAPWAMWAECEGDGR